MSFSSEIKSELCHVKSLDARKMRVMLYGMFYGGRASDGAVVFRSEHKERVVCAEYLAKKALPEAKRTLVSAPEGEQSALMLEGADCFGDFSRVESIADGGDAISGAFLRGVFLSCGYITDPAKEYHLEILLPESDRAQPLYDFIREHGIAVRLSTRASKPLIYAKESGVIEDFLTYIGAGLRALEIMQVKIEKDLRNRANRSANCDSANVDRTLTASERICREIQRVLEQVDENELPPELLEAARLRLANPESSLSELCELSPTPISKSGLNHRLKRLSEMAAMIDDRS